MRNKILNKPVVVMQLSPPKAMGIWFSDGPTVIDYFESPDLETSFSLVKSEFLTEQPKDYISTNFRTGKNVIYVSDLERVKKLRNTYSPERNSEINRNIEAYVKIFDSLNIKFKTIESPIGIIKMRQYDPNSSTPPKQNYY